MGRVVQCTALGSEKLRAGRGEDELGSQKGFFLEKAGFEPGFEAWVQAGKGSKHAQRGVWRLSLWVTLPKEWGGEGALWSQTRSFSSCLSA